MKHYFTLYDAPFKAIASKQKDIEMRLYDEKRKQIKENDVIEFTNLVTNETLTVLVIKMHVFDDFEKLYASFDKVRIGYKENEIASPSDMELYYSKQAIKENQVVGIEIKLIEK